MDPFLKTLLTQVGGLVAGAVVTAFDHPTGGLAQTLSTNPTIAIAYVGVSQLLHNLLSKYAPPATPASSDAAPATK
ncbi:MAG TPA: hypothetical protein VFB22_01205 [Candidatus Baltobacteraceae bacterium]|nr:hypothetical protein [Candidatus Baltobacteraceae bacterium]